MVDTSLTELEMKLSTTEMFMAHLHRSRQACYYEHALSEHWSLIKILADRLGLYVQAYTLYSSVRPFGISTILGAVDKDGPSLYVVEPSGIFFVSSSLSSPKAFKCIFYQGYNGAAVGKGRQLAKTELEKLNLRELTTREAVYEATRM